MNRRFEMLDRHFANKRQKAEGKHQEAEESRFADIPNDVVNHMFKNLTWRELARQSEISNDRKKKVKNYLNHLANKKDEDGISLLCKMHTNCEIPIEIKNKLTEDIKLDCTEMCVKKRLDVLQSVIPPLFTRLIEFCTEYLQKSPKADLTINIGISMGLADSRMRSTNHIKVIKTAGNITPFDTVEFIRKNMINMESMIQIGIKNNKNGHLELVVTLINIPAVTKLLINNDFILNVETEGLEEDEDGNLIKNFDFSRVL